MYLEDYGWTLHYDMVDHHYQTITPFLGIDSIPPNLTMLKAFAIRHHGITKVFVQKGEIWEWAEPDRITGIFPYSPEDNLKDNMKVWLQEHLPECLCT